MKLLQKILSHGLLIAFILAAIYAYIQRETLFPQWFPKSSHSHQQVEKDTQSKIEPVLPQENLSASPAGAGKAGDEPATVEATTVEPDEPARDDNPSTDEKSKESGSAMPENVSTTPEGRVLNEVTEAEPVPARAPTEIPGTTPADEVEVAQQQQAGITGIATPAQVEATREAGSVEAAEPKPVVVVKEAEAPVQEAKSVATDEPGDDRQLQAQLVQARQYFWQRNLPAAEEIYTSLAESYPDNPDLWGEIGNFYYSLRKRVPMIEAYTRSAKLLIARGEPQRARQLVRILHQLGSPQARQLEMEVLQQTGG